MKQIHLKGSWVIRAPRSEIYKIITDFESAPKYFPSAAKSVHIIKRDGEHLVIEAQTKAFLGSKTFKVRMDTHLQPPAGFVSENVSSVGIEHETFAMEEIPEGTKINYTNDVEIKSFFFRLAGRVLIGVFALKFWERAVINKLREMLEK